MSDYAMTIRGEDVEIVLGSLSLTRVANGISMLYCDVQSADASFRVALDDAVVLTKDGDVDFGGVVDSYRERAMVGWGAAIVTSVAVRDHSVLATRRYVTATFAEGVLKTFLAALVSDYLSIYGISLDGSQVDGPLVPETSYVRAKCSDVLNDLATRTGYIWQIDATLVLRMYAPSARPSPFDLSPTETHVVGDIMTEERREDVFANRAIVVVKGQGASTVTDTFVAADGVSSGGFTIFTLSYPIAELVSTVLRIDDVLRDQAIAPDVASLVTNGGAYAWAVDRANRQLVYDEATGATFPAGSEVLGLDYRIDVPFEVSWQDDTDVAARGPWEVIVPRDEALPFDAAEAIAEAEVTRRMRRSRKITYQTFDDGLECGQQQHATEPYRDLDVDTVVNQIASRMVRTDLMRHDVTLSEGSFQDTYQDVYKQWFGSSAGSVGASSAGSASSLPPVIFMGGSRNTAIAPSADTWVDAVNYIDYVPPTSYSALMRVELWSRQSGPTVRARLRDITAGITIGSVDTTATSPATLTFGAALTPGHIYRLQLASDTSGAGIYAIATM